MPQTKDQFVHHLSKIIAGAVRDCVRAHGEVEAGSVAKRVASQLWAELQAPGHATDADWVRSIRAQRNLTQSELARMLGTSQVTVGRWESGMRAVSPAYRQRLMQLVDEGTPRYSVSVHEHGFHLAGGDYDFDTLKESMRFAEAQPHPCIVWEKQPDGKLALVKRLVPARPAVRAHRRKAGAPCPFCGFEHEELRLGRQPNAWECPRCGQALHYATEAELRQLASREADRLRKLAEESLEKLRAHPGDERALSGIAARLDELQRIQADLQAGRAVAVEVLWRIGHETLPAALHAAQVAAARAGQALAKKMPPPVPPRKTIRIRLFLRIERNNKFVRGMSRARESIEDELLREFAMEKPHDKRPEYVLTIPYQSDEELDEIVEDILAEAESIAARYNCFTEGDAVALDDPTLIWPCED